jgi:hypothetical protein
MQAQRTSSAISMGRALRSRDYLVAYHQFSLIQLNREIFIVRKYKDIFRVNSSELLFCEVIIV